MIQIDMPMPKNCRMCPVCSEYDICLIPIDGKGFGEQNVSEFIDNRPEWCPMKEQEVVVRCKDCKHWEQSNGHCPFNSIFTNADWFCADGERRTTDGH